MVTITLPQELELTAMERATAGMTSELLVLDGLRQCFALVPPVAVFGIALKFVLVRQTDEGPGEDTALLGGHAAS